MGCPWGPCEPQKAPGRLVPLGGPLCTPGLQGVLDEGHHHRPAGPEPAPGALRSAFSIEAPGRAGALTRPTKGPSGRWCSRPLCQEAGAPRWKEKGQEMEMFICGLTSANSIRELSSLP